MKRNLYAIVEKGTKKAVSLIDESFLSWYTSHLPVFDYIPIRNTGSSSARTEFGTINAVSLIADEDGFGDCYYYMITSYPDDITLAEAYELISK